MSIVGQLILLHVVTGAMATLCVFSICSRRFDDLTYDARMSSPLRRLLMPGRLADRGAWRKQQKLFSWLGLVFVLIIYVLVMVKILHEHSA
jgi:hypothetical protein